jgi:hypothetical protein
MAKSHSPTVALWVGIKSRRDKSGRKEKSSMAAGQDIRVAHEEVEGFVHKLRDFHGSLGNSEQAMLESILDTTRGEVGGVTGCTSALGSQRRVGTNSSDG